MKQSTICPFCDSKQKYRQLVRGETVFVMYPKSPAIPYHLLIIPIRHIKHIDEMSADEIFEMHKYLKKFVDLASFNIKDFVGYNILSNNGTTEVNQQVKHCHLHLFLRRNTDIDPLVAKHSKDPEPLSAKQIEYLEGVRSWL